MSNVTRLDALQLDVDMRLREPWQLVFEVEEAKCGFDVELVGMLMRAAYATGYIDALKEPVVGLLHRDHGYRIPARNSLG